MDSEVGSTNLQTLLSYDEFEPMCTWQREDAQDVLILHLPDFTKEQLKIQISNTGLLKITGEYNVEGKRKRRFQKEVKVTKEYDSSNIHAKFSQGRLRITFPKKVVAPPVPASPPPMVTSSRPDDQSNNMYTTGQSVVPSVKAKVGQVLRSKEFTQIMVNLGFAVVLAFSIYNLQSDVTTTSDEPENRTVEEMKPVMVGVTSPVCNLDRFLESVTPSVTAQHPSKRTTKGWRTSDVEHQPYFVLGDLLESFKEWSAYGAGVPLVLDGTDGVIQYYVPYLSGIQIYGDPLKSSVKSRQPTEYSDGDSFKDSSSDVSSDYDEHDRCSLHYSREKQNNHHPNGEISRRMDQLSLNDQHHVLQEGFSSDDGDSISTQGCLLFEYLERNQPWGREPLTDKILDLARCFPELKSLRSCDLLPSSWLSVARVIPYAQIATQCFVICFYNFGI